MIVYIYIYIQLTLQKTYLLPLKYSYIIRIHVFQITFLWFLKNDFIFPETMEIEFSKTCIKPKIEKNEKYIQSF